MRLASRSNGEQSTSRPGHAWELRRHKYVDERCDEDDNSSQADIREARQYALIFEQAFM